MRENWAISCTRRAQHLIMFNRDGTSKQWCMLICSSCQRWGKDHGWELIAQGLGGDRSFDMKAAIRTLHTQKCFRHFAGQEHFMWQEHFTQLVPYAIRNFPCLSKNTSYCNEWLCTVSNQHVFLQRYPVCQAWLCFCAFVLFFFFFQPEKVEVLNWKSFTTAAEGTDNPAFSHIEMDVASNDNKANGLHIWHGAVSAHEDSFVHVKYCWHSCAGSVTSPAGNTGRHLVSYMALSPLHDLDISQERNQVFLALPHSFSHSGSWWQGLRQCFYVKYLSDILEPPGKYLLLVSVHSQSKFFIW